MKASWRHALFLNVLKFRAACAQLYCSVSCQVFVSNFKLNLSQIGNCICLKLKNCICVKVQNVFVSKWRVQPGVILQCVLVRMPPQRVVKSSREQLSSDRLLSRLIDLMTKIQANEQCKRGEEQKTGVKLNLLNFMSASRHQP